MEFANPCIPWGQLLRAKLHRKICTLDLWKSFLFDPYWSYFGILFWHTLVFPSRTDLASYFRPYLAYPTRRQSTTHDWHHCKSYGGDERLELCLRWKWTLRLGWPCWPQDTGAVFCVGRIWRRWSYTHVSISVSFKHWCHPSVIRNNSSSPFLLTALCSFLVSKHCLAVARADLRPPICVKTTWFYNWFYYFLGITNPEPHCRCY